MTTKYHIQTDNICRICFQPGHIKSVERQYNGTVMMSVHEDGTTHHWLTYDSLLGIGQKKPKLPTIVCPKCGHRGRLYEFHPKDYARSDFYVVHGTIEQNRCYIREPQQRETILKKLGRYIA